MKYIDSNHSYINENGESFLSVTTLIKKYEPVKDWDEIASKYAKKHKKTLEEVQAAWKEEGRKAIEKGLKFHSEMESLYVEKGTWEIDGKEYKVVPTPMVDGVKIAIPLKLEDGIYPELIVYSDKYKVSGQADLVEVVEGKINIKDYKTSRQIKLESHKHWRDGHEMMLFPVGHLMNCNFYQYSLQLNIYMALLKAHNRKLKIGNMEILHVTDDGIIPYEVPDLQKEAKAILEHYYNEINYVLSL